MFIHNGISETILGTFKKYIPETEYGVRELHVSGETYQFPCLVIPKDTNPALVNVLMRHFKIANISYK